MTADEFVKACVLGGYCRKKEAKTYAKGKEELTVQDIETVYRQCQERQSREEAVRQKFKDYQGAKTTKQYYHGRRNFNGVDCNWED